MKFIYIAIPSFIIYDSCIYDVTDILQTFEIPEDSKLQIIEKEAFLNSPIERFKASNN